MAVKDDLQKQVESLNIADDYDDDTLRKIGKQICEWYDQDEDSRSDWLIDANKSLKLALQVVERKSFPWPDAANVKYPLLTTAAMQFAARAYPALVPGPNIITGQVIGRDMNGEKAQAAKRVGAHMSWQVFNEMTDWEEDMDKLCLMLPILGCVFKKTYYDPLEKRNCSDLILPKDFVIDYYAKSVEKANRKFHVIYRNKNQIVERVRKEIFRDCELGQPVADQSSNNQTKRSVSKQTEPSISPATPYKLLESYVWWDMDDDGYDEPYTITVHYDTQQVLRIIPRFEMSGVEFNKDGEIARITPIEYFTKFGFIPNPDGSIYDLGFGLLLGGINETVNTVTNQLLDAGTINNLQSGFLGRGIRVKSGNTRFAPGEWKISEFNGDDMRKHIVPLPTKEPSDTLFKLLETLVTSGKELSSIAEIMVGKMPGQNTPATTTMATIEQGLKVFTAIHKRLYRALNSEYKKLYRLNAIHMEEKIYFTINQPQGPDGQEVYRKDYSMEVSVKPNADPNVVSQSQKLMKVQAYGPLLQLGTINSQEYTKRFLEACDEDNIEALMKPNPQQPSPEAQQAQLEMQQSAQMHQSKMEEQQQKAQLQAQSGKQAIVEKATISEIKARGEQQQVLSEAQMMALNNHAEAVSHKQKMTHAEELHQQALRHAHAMAAVKTHAAHQQGQAKAHAASKPKAGK